MENLSKQLVDKSIESFILDLEIYNKPLNLLLMK